MWWSCKLFGSSRKVALRFVALGIFFLIAKRKIIIVIIRRSLWFFKVLSARSHWIQWIVKLPEKKFLINGVVICLYCMCLFMIKDIGIAGLKNSPSLFLINNFFSTKCGHKIVARNGYPVICFCNKHVRVANQPNFMNHVRYGNTELSWKLQK